MYNSYFAKPETPHIHVPLPHAWKAFQFYIENFGAKSLELQFPMTNIMGRLTGYQVGLFEINGLKLIVSDAHVSHPEFLKTNASKMTIHVGDPLKFANLALEHGSEILVKICRPDGFCCFLSIQDPFHVIWTFVNPEEEAFLPDTPQGSSFVNPEDEFYLNVPAGYLVDEPEGSKDALSEDALQGSKDARQDPKMLCLRMRCKDPANLKLN